MTGHRSCRWAVVVLLMGAVSAVNAQRIVPPGDEVIPVFLPIEPAVPATQPSREFGVRLENPRNSQAVSYVDLDTGKTFTYGESFPNNQNQSRRWLRESGADLMCETRAPADGFAAYDLVLVPVDETFEGLNLYNVVANQVRIEAEPFALVAVNAAAKPRVYAFRTREGAIGVLEVGSVGEEPQELKLRIKILQRPQSPVPQHAFVRQGKLVIGRAASEVFFRGVVPYAPPTSTQIENQKQRVPATFPAN